MSVKPVITELTEKMTMEMRKVGRRPMKSEMTPPRKPPEVMPMKYQKRMVAMSLGSRPQDWDRQATKPKFQLSNCSKKYAAMMMKNNRAWMPRTGMPSK